MPAMRLPADLSRTGWRQERRGRLCSTVEPWGFAAQDSKRAAMKNLANSDDRCVRGVRIEP